MVRKNYSWTSFMLRFMYVITILLVQTDVLTADDVVPHFQNGIYYIMLVDEAGDEIEPDDDYTRTRTGYCPSVAYLPILPTLIPNQYILSKKNHTPKPTDCIICKNSRQAELCIFLI